MSSRGHRRPSGILRRHRNASDPILLAKKKIEAACYGFNRDWAKLFGKMDADHSGSLDAEEFRLALRRVARVPRTQLSDDDILTLFHAIDGDNGGNGTVELSEFAEFMNRQIELPPAPAPAPAPAPTLPRHEEGGEDEEGEGEEKEEEDQEGVAAEGVAKDDDGDEQEEEPKPEPEPEPEPQPALEGQEADVFVAAGAGPGEGNGDNDGGGGGGDNAGDYKQASAVEQPSSSAQMAENAAADDGGGDGSAAPLLPACSRVLFHITGFGCFHGVSDNPTMHVLDVVRQHPQLFAGRHHSVGQTAVFTVSTVDVDDGLAELRSAALAARQEREEREKAKAGEVEDADDASSVREVWVHLGVHGGARETRLETRAYNDISFDVPDERGFQPPQSTPIAPAGPAYLDTAVPVGALIETPGLKGCTAPSLNPGRFLCNYVYFRSLSAARGATAAAAQAAQATAEAKGVAVATVPRGGEDALFIHVPPFTCQPLAEQVRIMSHALHHIAAAAVRTGSHPTL